MRNPNSSSPPFPVSTNEWMPSESIAELPVKKAATNLVAAMARLPAIAAKIAVLDSVCMLVRTACGSGRLILAIRIDCTGQAPATAGGSDLWDATLITCRNEVQIRQ